MAVVIYFVVMAVQGTEEEEPADNIGTEAIGHEGLSFEHNHAELTYHIYFDSPDFELRIVDAEGFVVETIISPRNGRATLRSNTPIVLQERAGAVYVLSPREAYGRVIVIDPGHGGNDHGAPGPGGVRESEIVLDISLRLYDIFANSNSGIRAFMTRHEDVFVTPASRVAFANAVGHKFISIHTNSFEDSSVAGTETLYNPMANPLNLLLAQTIQNHLVNELGTRDRGLFIRNDIYALNNISIPAVFTEIDFKTNPAALANLQDAAFQQRIAQALYAAIVSAFNTLPQSIANH